MNSTPAPAERRPAPEATVAAAEVAVGLAILVALSRVFPVVNIDQLDDLRG